MLAGPALGTHRFPLFSSFVVLRRNGMAEAPIRRLGVAWLCEGTSARKICKYRCCHGPSGCIKQDTITATHPFRQHTRSTTTRIAREFQYLSVAPIMGSLPRPLWPHDVVACVHRPGECMTTPGPLGEQDETKGSRPQDDTGFFFLVSRHPVCTGFTEQMTSCNTSRPKLIAKRRRADKAQSDGLRQQTKNNKDEVRRRTDRQAIMF